LVRHRALEINRAGVVNLSAVDSGSGQDRMTTLAKQRERAARLFQMASDAFGRGEPEFAEILIQKANQYADQAAGLQSCGGEQRQQNE
jgi:phage shock protein A